MTSNPAPFASAEACPRCGFRNGCQAEALAAGGTCWCQGAPSLSPELLQSIAEKWPGRCLCARCLHDIAAGLPVSEVAR